MENVVHRHIGHELCFSDERKFKKVFGVGFTINLWLRHAQSVAFISTLYESKCQKCIQLDWYTNDEKECKWHWDFEDGAYTRSYITPVDEFNCSIKTIWHCRNNGCWRQFSCKSESEAHSQTCRFRLKQKVISYKQKRMSEYDEGESLLRDLGFTFTTRAFVSYDIECITVENPNRSDVLPQNLCSIGCRASWKTEGKIFHRLDSNPSSAMALVKDFVAYLHELQEEYEKSLPLEDIAEKLKDLEKLSFATEFEKNRAAQVIENLKRLKVLAFNAERYDCIQLYPFLVVLFGQRNEEISVIKRGSGIMSLASAFLLFLDAINFVGGMSLKDFGTNYAGMSVEKGIFPHRCFKSIEEMRNCRHFPKYEEFKSDLNPSSDEDLKRNYSEYKKYRDNLYTEFEEDIFSGVAPNEFHTSIDQYLLNLKEFETKILNGTWTSFIDYLSKYCLIDVNVLLLGMSNYIEEFISEFQISPIDSISMPSLAAKIMWRSYAATAPSVFSFSSNYGFLNEKIREKALLGGYVGKCIDF